MKFEKISIEDSLNFNYWNQHGLTHGLIYCYDSVQLKPIEELMIDETSLFEAHIFGFDKEIHIFRREVLEAVIVTDEAEDDIFVEKQLLIDRFGKEIKVKNYLKYDGDGQAYIAYSRPCQVSC